MLTPELRLDVQEFYFRYAECLDGGRLTNWPSFFTESCVYRLTTRRGMRGDPEDDLMYFTTRSAMLDRIVALSQSEDYEPHQQRHFISNFRIQVSGENELRVNANFQVSRTFPEQSTEVFLSGFYQDHVEITGTRLAFREKLCILDSELRPETLVYPA